MTDTDSIQRARAIVVDIVRFLLEAQALAAVRAAVRVLNGAAVGLNDRPTVETTAAAHFVTRLAAMLENAHELEAAGYGAPIVRAVASELERTTAAERGELEARAACSICHAPIEPGDPHLERAALCAPCSDLRGELVERLVSSLASSSAAHPWPTPLDVVSYAGELVAARMAPVQSDGTIRPSLEGVGQ